MKTSRLILTAAIAWVCTSALPAQQPVASPTIQEKLDQIIIPTVRFQNATIEEALDYLRVKGRDFDKSDVPPASKGVSFVLKKDASKTPAISLDLKDVPLAMAVKYCVELAGLEYRVEPYGILIAPSFEPAPAPPPVVGNADKITFPTVQFSGATLEEAVEYFRVKSRDADPSKKGVNIVIKPGGSAANISLDLRNVPLPYALNYCAMLSDHQLTTDGNIYLFSPLKTR